ncbi:hypothetical protein GCM10028777_18340 [Angustibacter speluncae]
MTLPPVPPAATSGLRLAVDVTPADLEHLVLTAHRRLPSYRRTLWGVRVLSGLLVLAIGAVLSHVALGWGAMALYAPASVLAGWWAPRGVLRAAVRRTIGPMTQDRSGSVLGPRELEVLAGQLVERWPHGENRVDLSALHDVVRTPSAALVLISPLAGCVLPRERVLAGDHDAFVDGLVAAWHSAREPD